MLVRRNTYGMDLGKTELVEWPGRRGILPGSTDRRHQLRSRLADHCSIPDSSGADQIKDTQAVKHKLLRGSFFSHYHFSRENDLVIQGKPRLHFFDDFSRFIRFDF